MILQNKKYKHLFLLLSIYFLLRVITYYFQIYPVGNELSLKWQFLDAQLLKKDFLNHYIIYTINLQFGILYMEL